MNNETTIFAFDENGNPNYNTEEFAVNQVYVTTDYDIFSFSKSNRYFSYREEMFLEAQRGFIAPIIVNEKLVVIDGQNRLYHAKMAKVPVEYIVKDGLGDDDIIRMNTSQKSWSLQNYVESFANQDFEEYIKLVELLNQTKHGVTALAQVGYNAPAAGKITNIIKDGKFKFHNYDKTLEFLDFEKKFREETGLKRKLSTTNSLYELFRHKGIDFDRLIKKTLETGLDKELGKVKYNHQAGVQRFIDVYNERLSPGSSNYIAYSVNNTGKLRIERELQDWALPKK